MLLFQLETSLMAIKSTFQVNDSASIFKHKMLSIYACIAHTSTHPSNQISNQVSIHLYIHLITHHTDHQSMHHLPIHQTTMHLSKYLHTHPHFIWPFICISTICSLTHPSILHSFPHMSINLFIHSCSLYLFISL